jgi:nuclear receptor interaction protein
MSSDTTMSEDEDDEVAANGLRSRKAMHNAYKITSENDMNRKGGGEEAFITRALLAQLAQRARAHRQDVGEEDDGGETIVLGEDDNCTIM